MKRRTKIMALLMILSIALFTGGVAFDPFVYSRNGGGIDDRGALSELEMIREWRLCEIRAMRAVRYPEVFAP